MTDKPAVEDTFDLNLDDLPFDLPGGNDDIVVDMSPTEREEFAAMLSARASARVQRRAEIKRLAAIYNRGAGLADDFGRA